MESIHVVNGEITLNVTIDGTGPTVLLLHGWPDTSALWSEVAADLVTAGYRVAVPDLRGCGVSDKPTDVGQYAMHHLVSDVAAIIAALGDKKVTLIGHDWGANLAWVSAAYLPELIERLVVLSVGHPTSFRSAGLEQQIKSWYTLLFFHEGVGEAFLRKNDYEAIRRWSGHPRPEEIIKELERDGQMTTHLLWYRANLPPSSFVSDPPRLPPLAVPVLGMWSSGDAALSELQMTNSAIYCDQGFTYVRFEDFGHWLPIEAPHDVSAEIIKFFSSVS